MAAKPPCMPGTGWYLTCKVLEKLSSALANADLQGSWRALAGELDINDQKVQEYEVMGCKPGHSPARDMLRDYQNREGGIDFHKFRDALLSEDVGRGDIVTDIWTEEAFRAGQLLERRPGFSTDPASGAAPPPSTTPVSSGPFPSGKDELPVAGSSVRRKDPRKQPSPRPHSDPPRRRGSQTLTDHADTHSSSDSRESVSNLKGSYSDSVVCGSADFKENTKRDRRENQRGDIERESFQQQAKYSSLRVPRPPPEEQGASPNEPSYLMVSTREKRDLHLCRNAGNILKRQGHRVFSVHQLHDQMNVSHIFCEVAFVVVIYTKEYQDEIYDTGTRNCYLFKMMQAEYNRYNENRRCIAIYDTDVITEMPKELLANRQGQSDYIIGLLTRHGSRSPQHPSAKGLEERHSLPPNGSANHQGSHGHTQPNAQQNIASLSRKVQGWFKKQKPNITREYHTTSK